MADAPRYEFTRAMVAAYRLAQLDLRAVDLFEKTPTAAWRSLRYLLYCIPFFMAMVWPRAGELHNSGFSTISYVILVSEQMLIAALGFFLVLHHLTRRMGVTQNFAHYVCVECYVALPITIVVALLTGLWTIAGVNDQAAGILQVLVYAAQIVIDWGVTYATLRVRPLAAFAICIMAVMFTKVVQLFMTLLIILSMPGSMGMATP